MLHNNSFVQSQMSLGQKLLHMHWFFIILLCITATVGFAMLYSAAGGDLDPWASRQMVRFALGLLGMTVVAVIDIRLWLRFSYGVYFVVLALLIAVEIAGFVGMGAQRWISLGIFNVQPSELMKVAVVLALARYFHGGSIEEIERPTFLIPPLLMVAVPAFLILRQPDLGTTIMVVAASIGIFFAAGVRIWKFALVGALGLVSAPVAWFYLLRDYQRARIMTFINPEQDTLGSGYHIIQSKIALGSGGVFGKGYLMGTQGHLNFLPEKQTDFIFTMLAEEFGLVGGLGLLALYILLLFYGFSISLSSRNHFGRLLGMGVTITFFLYIFINIAMVMGLIPVVGVPLPLVSYGGTAMLTILFGFGLLMCVHINRDLTIGRRDSGDEF
ncbi:MAG: rod shape-determining protein RodA [Rhodospirillaceae bacterium]|nr:rod shape-determining protein RodA [Rhodospirillaceae bacterium]